MISAATGRSCRSPLSRLIRCAAPRRDARCVLRRAGRAPTPAPRASSCLPGMRYDPKARDARWRSGQSASVATSRRVPLGRSAYQASSSKPEARKSCSTSTPKEQRASRRGAARGWARPRAPARPPVAALIIHGLLFDRIRHRRSDELWHRPLASTSPFVSSGARSAASGSSSGPL